MHASTSPFYPLFATLDVNAQMHAARQGGVLWDALRWLGIEARKKLRDSAALRATGQTRKCSSIRSCPTCVDPRYALWQDARTPWEDLPTDVLKRSSIAGVRARANAGTAIGATPKATCMVDPTKLLLIDAGIDAATGEYPNFGVPATILANYLRENGSSRRRTTSTASSSCLRRRRTRASCRHADREAREVRECSGIAMRRSRRCSRRCAADSERYAGYTHPPARAGDARLLPPRESRIFSADASASEASPNVAMPPKAYESRWWRRCGLRAARGHRRAYRRHSGPDLSAGHWRLGPGRALGRGRSRCSTTSSPSRIVQPLPGFAYEVQGVFQEQD